MDPAPTSGEHDRDDGADAAPPLPTELRRPQLPALDPAFRETTREPAALAAALGAVLERHAEEAATSRSHLRELIRAVDTLAQSHEYVGTALRGERRRNRWLLAALAAVPVVLAGGVWAVWSQVRENDRRLDEVRSSFADEVRQLQGRHATEREDAIRREFADRVTRLEEDASTARTDLEAARQSLGDERSERAAREQEARERLERAERELAELAAYRAEVRTLRDALGAERARTDALAKSIAAAQRPPEPAPSPEASSSSSSPAPAETSAAASAAPPKPPAESASARAASKSPEDLARVRDLLNGLLSSASGGSRWRVEDLSGVSGSELLGVRVVVEDASGRVLRTIEAPRSEVSVAASGEVRWRFDDGHLVVGGRRAPFFDGTYVLSLEGKFESWRDCGLTCIRLP